MPNDAAAGYLDLLLLAAVRTMPGGHGYALIEELRRRSRGQFDLTEGSVYPALHRLEAEGLLRSHWTTVGGRRRRAYELTNRGLRALGERETAWRRYVAAMAGVLEG